MAAALLCLHSALNRTRRHPRSSAAVCCSAKHALRPYLYILLHWPLARAAQVVAAALGHKAWTFYLVRAALSLVAAVLDVRLIRCATCAALEACCLHRVGPSAFHMAPKWCEPAWQQKSPAVTSCSARRAWRGRGGHAAPLALLLALSAGCFLAPATLLPSTFAMYCMTAATTGVLAGRVQVRFCCRSLPCRRLPVAMRVRSRSRPVWINHALSQL